MKLISQVAVPCSPVDLTLAASIWAIARFIIQNTKQETSEKGMQVDMNITDAIRKNVAVITNGNMSHTSNMYSHNFFALVTGPKRMAFM